jgi:hypothetical protein
MHTLDGVDVFQGINTGVVKQIKANWSPQLIGVHCVVSLQFHFWSLGCLLVQFAWSFYFFQ